MRLGRIAASIFCVLILLAAGPVVEMAVFHNLHEVSPGKFYRSAQMGRDALADVTREKGIKSIINLRGQNDAEWYRTETNFSSDVGVKHYDFALSASQEVTVEEMDRIVATLHDAPKPILLHCKSGADRTGLVSALYLMTQEGAAPEKAADQLTIRCFHFPHLFWRDTIAMDHSFQRYVDSAAGKITGKADAVGK